MNMSVFSKSFNGTTFICVLMYLALSIPALQSLFTDKQHLSELTIASSSTPTISEVNRSYTRTFRDQHKMLIIAVYACAISAPFGQGLRCAFVDQWDYCANAHNYKHGV